MAIRRLLIPLVLCFLLSACKETVSNINLPNEETQTNFIWNIIIIAAEEAENLSTTQAAVQYNGVKVDVPYLQKPSAGNTFLLLEMNIKKQVTGASKFSWDNVYVLDANGNKYQRHPNDTFLESHNFTRLKATDLTIGETEGFVCFEIPKDITDGDLYFVHVENNKENKVKITLKK